VGFAGLPIMVEKGHAKIEEHHKSKNTMEFGKIKDLNMLDQMDFSLARDPAYTQNSLSKSPLVSKPEIYVGCPVWVNKNWVGRIYPIKTKEKDYLSFYTQQFNTLELNVTHYQIPEERTVERWKKMAEPNFFHFCPKFPQQISHEQILKSEFRTDTQIFCQSISLLDEKLGISFLQLPPYFEPKYLPLLQKFLDFTCRKLSLALELRHPGWFKSYHLEKLAQILTDRDITLTITDVAGRRDVLHLYLTTPVLFLRFVGNQLHKSDYIRIDQWVDKIEEWIKLGLQKVYFFAHECNNDFAPDLANYFIQQMNKRLDLGLKEVSFYNQDIIQGSLF